MHNAIIIIIRVAQPTLLGGAYMPRINLSIDEDLFKQLEEDAKNHNSSINVFVISILERLYKQNPFDYEAALTQLIVETKSKEIGEEFTLVELPSFSDICVAKAEDAKVKPSIVRARLGKMFNSAVANEMIVGIKRARTEQGELKFTARAAVYIREEETHD